MARAFFNRTIPFGFTRDENFYNEVVDIANASNLLIRAESARALAEQEKKVRESGRDASTLAKEMAEVLKNG